jgi:hypothetical protein
VGVCGGMLVSVDCDRLVFCLLCVYVDVCGCMWVYVGVCVYVHCDVLVVCLLCVYVGVCGCMWVYVGVC